MPNRRKYFHSGHYYSGVKREGAGAGAGDWNKRSERQNEKMGGGGLIGSID